MNQATRNDESFIDTWEEWEAWKIRNYSHSENYQDDYSFFIELEVLSQLMTPSEESPESIEKYFSFLLGNIDKIIKLPPYIVDANRWQRLYNNISEIYKHGSSENEELQRLLASIKWKAKIMEAREQFLKHIESARKKQLLASVVWWDWIEEQIEEYKSDGRFETDYMKFANFHLCLKQTFQFSEPNFEEIEGWYRKSMDLYNEIIEAPVWALDESLGWWEIWRHLQILQYALRDLSISETDEVITEEFKKKAQCIEQLVEVIARKDDYLQERE